jgi:dienelactone hydrolase
MRQKGFDVVGVLGHSMGGNIVLLYASEYQDVKFAVNFCGRALMHRGIYDRFSSQQLEALRSTGQLEWRVGKNMILIVTAASIEERLQLKMQERASAIPDHIDVGILNQTRLLVLIEIIAGSNSTWGRRCGYSVGGREAHR